MRTVKIPLSQVRGGQVIVGGIPDTMTAHSHAHDFVFSVMPLTPGRCQVELGRMAGPLPLGCYAHSVVTFADTPVDIAAPIDYEALLRKYVKHVTDCEGANYVDHIGDPLSEVEFTPEEAAELRRIDKELFGGDHA